MGEALAHLEYLACSGQFERRIEHGITRYQRLNYPGQRRGCGPPQAQSNSSTVCTTGIGLRPAAA